MSRSGSRFGVLLAAVLVLAVSLAVRERWNARVHVPGEERWIVMDSDSQYHMRRLARLMDEGFPVAGRDPYLNYPDGAAIPWPPYYTVALWCALAPFAPSDPIERRVHVEEGVASLPMLFGAATSLVALAAAWTLAGPAAGLFAGLHHALALGSITYSRAGNGDHHAWVSLLTASMLLCATLAFRRGALDRARAGAAWGALTGALAGLLVGSWVASLLDVIGFELALGVLLVWNATRPRRGIAAFGFAFHVAALLVLLPALLTSPWKDEHPWIVVNLSWFHALHLALGAIVFVPLFFLRPGTPFFRLHPWLVAASLLVLGVLFALLDVGPGAGVREGFAWISRENQFMAQVGESLPLLGSGSDSPRALFEHLGYGAALLPFAWILAVSAAWRARDAALLPWVVSAGLLAVQALAQRRFADALATPMAVLLAWALAFGWSRLRAGVTPRARLVAAFAAILLAVGSHWSGVVGPTFARLGERSSELDPQERNELAGRLMVEWLRARSPPTGDYCVLANWGNGHLIEWGGDRPTAATNFGTYVGEESFQDPPRFFMEEDHTRAEEILERRRARYVLLLSALPRFVGEMVRTACPERWDRYIDAAYGKGGPLRDAFFDTLAAHLLLGGVRLRQGGPPGPSIDFLRLVHASPMSNEAAPLALSGMEKPHGFLWEHVRGARVEAVAAPGSELRVALRVEYPAARYQVVYQRRATAGSDGIARVRVPYATLAPNGDGRVVGEARWSLGERSGVLALSEQDVLDGQVVRLE